MVERDGNGRFKKGHSGGPGRPKKKREERYYEIMQTTVTYSDWRIIIEKARDQAKRGDAVARKWLADYLIGTPQQNVDVTSGGDALCIVIQGPDERKEV